jgi:hypothetical protein
MSSQPEKNYAEFVQALASAERYPDYVTNMMMLGVTQAVINAADGSMDNIKKDLFYGKSTDKPPFGRATAFDPDFTDAEWDLFHAIMGMITEAGELAIVLKGMVQGREVDEVNLLEELGDMRFYQQLAYNALGADDGEVVHINVQKLLKRYKGGEFSSEEALSRDLQAERTALEGGTDE